MSLKEAIREEVRFSLSNDQRVDESFGVVAGLAAIAGLGAGWNWIRNKVRQLENKAALDDFIAEHDTQKIIEKQLPETLRRFKMVTNLTDLERMEEKIEQMFNQIDAMTSRVDEYVDQTYRSEKEVHDKVLIRDPRKEKQRIKQFIKDFVNNSKDTFSKQVEQKKDDLLA